MHSIIPQTVEQRKPIIYFCKVNIIKQ